MEPAPHLVLRGVRCLSGPRGARCLSSPGVVVPVCAASPHPARSSSCGYNRVECAGDGHGFARASMVLAVASPGAWAAASSMASAAMAWRQASSMVALSAGGGS